jgi:DNA repair photolyase
MPAEIAIADAYAKAIKTDDLVAVGKANSTNTKAYYDGRKKLNEHAEALGAVKAMFDRLPRGGLIDGCTKWSRWQESNFGAYDKNQRDYMTKIAKSEILRLRGEEPKKKEKKDYKTLALDLARMVLDGDRDSAEKLAQQITQNEKAENSAFSTKADPVPVNKKRKKAAPAKKQPNRNNPVVQNAIKWYVTTMSAAKQQKSAPTKKQPKRNNTSLIYEPGGITEFARLALNREVGCVHDCKYCYGPASMHVKREDWTKPRAKNNYLTNLLFDLRKREKRGLPKHQVLMEYSGDCYGDPADTLTGESIKLLHDFGYGVCILTKAPMNAVKDIPLFNPKIDCLGCTITTFDKTEIAEWESKAPSPQDRLAALKEFHSAGIYTWVSMEPIISPASSLQVVALTHQFVDHYKTGLMNVRGVPLPDGYSNHDWKAYAADFIAMCESYDRSWFAKHTLESYLPVGAVNEKFRPMCHG